MRGGEVDQTGVHRCGKGVGGKGSVGPPPDRLNDCVAARLIQPGFIIGPPPDGPERLRGGRLVHRCVNGVGGKGSVGPPPDGPEQVRGGEVDRAQVHSLCKIMVRSRGNIRISGQRNIHPSFVVSQGGRWGTQDAVKRLAEMVPSDRLRRSEKSAWWRG